MARKNRDFGEMRESAPTDDDFLLRVGEHMGRSRSQRGKRVAAIGVWTVIIAFMAMTVLTAIQVDNNRVLNAQLRDTLTTQYNPSFKTRYSELGEATINAWYNTNPSPAPVRLAEGVTWPHSTTTDRTDWQNELARRAADNPDARFVVRNVTFIGGFQQESSPGSGLFFEINSYSAYVDGTLSTITVTFALPDLEDYATLPTLMSEPTITYGTGALGSSVASTQPDGWRSLNVSDNLTQQVDAWAEAYSNNDTADLKQITGDGGDSQYVGALGAKGWEYVEDSARIVWAYENGGNTNEAVAQIVWRMKLPDVVVEAETANGEDTVIPGAVQTQRMEILIQEPASGLPRIVAWGPVGTYMILNAETNRLTQDEFDAIVASIQRLSQVQPEPQPEPEPTETPTEEPQPTEEPSPSGSPGGSTNGG